MDKPTRGWNISPSHGLESVTRSHPFRWLNATEGVGSSGGSDRKPGENQLTWTSPNWCSEVSPLRIISGVRVNVNPDWDPDQEYITWFGEPMVVSRAPVTDTFVTVGRGAYAGLFSWSWRQAYCFTVGSVFYLPTGPECFHTLYRHSLHPGTCLWTEVYVGTASNDSTPGLGCGLLTNPSMALCP